MAPPLGLSSFPFTYSYQILFFMLRLPTPHPMGHWVIGGMGQFSEEMRKAGTTSIPKVVYYTF